MLAFDPERGALAKMAYHVAAQTQHSNDVMHVGLEMDRFHRANGNAFQLDFRVASLEPAAGGKGDGHLWPTQGKLLQGQISYDQRRRDWYRPDPARPAGRAPFRLRRWIAHGGARSQSVRPASSALSPQGTRMHRSQVAR
jgi:hypothetical protein